MTDTVKFTSKIDRDLVMALEAYIRDENRRLTEVLTEAAEGYLAKGRLRPEFRDAAQVVMTKYDELLRRLAR